ncbi:MAG: hypothetical protein QM775_17620 [Pirellulales bacterium]
MAHRVRFKEQPEAIAKQWETVLKATPKADLIVIREETAINYLEGLFGDVYAGGRAVSARRRNHSGESPEGRG